MRRLLLLTFAPVVLATSAGAQMSDKRPLDHSVYDSWNDIADEQLSNDGAWLTYALVPSEGDAVLHVRAAESATAFEIQRGRSARFSGDRKYIVFLIKPELAAERAAKKAKAKADDQPKDSLGILNLATGDIVRVARVKSFEVPEEGGTGVAYLLEREREASEPDSAKGAEQEQPAAPEPAKVEGEEGEKPGDKKKKDKKDGTTLVLRNLVTGAEQRFASVTAYAFGKDGAYLAYVTSTKDGSGDGAFVVETRTAAMTPLIEGEGNYKSPTFDEAGRQLALLSNRDDYQDSQPSYTIYHWKPGDAAARAVVAETMPGIPETWWVSEHGALSFSKNSRRLFFGTAPRPAPDPDEETPEWEEVKVDVWHWKDPLLQPMQLVQRERELNRTYRAVLHLRAGRIVQLADVDLPEVDVIAEGDGPVGFGTSNVPYRQRISWDSPGYSDAYVVNVETGQRQRVLEEHQGSADLSPGGKYVYWWDGHRQAWFARPVRGGEPVNLSAAIPHRVDNELHDWPMIPSSYGNAGWTENDEAFLVYDAYDIWALDPTGARAPRSVTEGMGRARNLEFRYVRLDRDQQAIPVGQPILLRALNEVTKASGFYGDRVRGTEAPRELVMLDRFFGFPRKADDADVVMFTRSSFQEFPDLWVSDLSFADMRRMSDANPQQAEYLWGSAELVSWRSTDGREIDGMLFKPENFDPSRKYPMMVYFYEKMSDGLHRFRNPGPGGSSISASFYASRGYVVFIPDIHYRVGYPGESALDCVVPGVLSVLAQGFVDPQRVGVQGHSWGGYQIAYMVTQTDIFAAAEAGAPVANMTSAYGGIRWGTGMSRMFQYERTQSRIGGTLWDAYPRYIENSPLFRADKINTPILMMHNDEDTAVPWYQGIEFFVALRRLGKPTWLLNYNGEPHGLRKYQNRKDWAIRMQQFFDHFLKDAPAPVWLAEGVPAVDKGKASGLELMEVEAPATVGSVGR